MSYLFLFYLQYEAVTVPYPKDVETPKINEKEKELVRFASATALAIQ